MLVSINGGIKIDDVSLLFLLHLSSSCLWLTLNDPVCVKVEADDSSASVEAEEKEAEATAEEVEEQKEDEDEQEEATVEKEEVKEEVKEKCEHEPEQETQEPEEDSGILSDKERQNEEVNEKDNCSASSISSASSTLEREERTNDNGGFDSNNISDTFQKDNIDKTKFENWKLRFTINAYYQSVYSQSKHVLH